MLTKELKEVLNQLNFPQNQYYRQSFPKRQIYLHHTASGKGYDGDFRHWLNNPNRIATFCIIDNNNINQLFSSDYWGHHLGIKSTVFKQRKLPSINKYLNQRSIGIEIDSWGQLVELNGEFYSWAGTKVNNNKVCKLDKPFKVYSGSEFDKNFFYKKEVSGKPCFYYEKYSDKQLYFLSILLPYLSKRFDIDITYNDDIWDVTDRALTGKKGLFTHNSVRVDKSDIFPQPELIELLKSF